jgi:hypothetical protein
MHRELRHTYSSSFAAANTKTKSSNVCRICSDIVLLGFWAAMVPAFLWMGNAAGF